MDTVSIETTHRIRTEHMRWLAEYNRRWLRNIFDPDLVRCFEARKASAEQCMAAHRQIEDILCIDTYHSSKGLDLCKIMRNDEVLFRSLTDKYVALTLDSKIGQVERLLMTGMVPILIRPEMYHIRFDIIDYLISQGCFIFGEYEKRINFGQYWILYEHVFGDTVKEMHVRRRMFGYLHKPAYLILVGIDTNSNSMQNADLMVRNFKGRAGFFQANTLCGDVIFREVSNILSRNDDTELFAIDPIMEYIHNDDTVYEEGVVSKLHANLHGIHLPEYHEVKKDICALLTEEEIDGLVTAYAV